MVTSMCNNLPRKKMKLMARFLTESVKRFQQGDHNFLTHADLRRCFTEGASSIYMNLPVPHGVSGGEAFDNLLLFQLNKQ